MSYVVDVGNGGDVVVILLLCLYWGFAFVVVIDCVLYVCALFDVVAVALCCVTGYAEVGYVVMDCLHHGRYVGWCVDCSRLLL